MLQQNSIRIADHVIENQIRDVPDASHSTTKHSIVPSLWYGIFNYSVLCIFTQCIRTQQAMRIHQLKLWSTDPRMRSIVTFNKPVFLLNVILQH